MISENESLYHENTEGYNLQMPSLLMIKEIEKQTGANYLEEIDRHTRLTEKQELKIKQMTTDIADMIEKDTAVPQGNDGIF